MESVYKKICSIPQNFLAVKNISIKQLIKESGFDENIEKIKLDELANFIKLNPNYVDSWLQYSSDKRTSSGWYFSKTNDKYLIGYLNSYKNEKVEEYDSVYNACANFILRELSSI